MLAIFADTITGQFFYSLQVVTEIDENGVETIQGCTLFYLDGSIEKTWEFSDLNGKIYRDITLNEDRSQAIITWEDNNKINESVFDIKEKKFLIAKTSRPLHNSNI